MSAPSPPPPTPRQGSARARPQPTTPDVVRVVVLLALGIVLAGWLGSLFRNQPEVEPDTVDYRAIAAAAQEGAGFPLTVPSRLPQAWRATSARWDPTDRQWHIGVLTGDEEYVGLEQSGAGLAQARRAFAPDSTQAGTVDVARRPWLRFVDGQTGEVTLMEERSRSVVAVTGSVPEATLAAYAAWLTASS